MTKPLLFLWSLAICSVSAPGLAASLEGPVYFRKTISILPWDCRDQINQAIFQNCPLPAALDLRVWDEWVAGEGLSNGACKAKFRTGKIKIAWRTGPDFERTYILQYLSCPTL